LRRSTRKRKRKNHQFPWNSLTLQKTGNN
jgi:hypothetical protein